MDTTTHKVDLPYEKEELLMLVDLASKEDVEEGGGRYDRRGGAINVWSHAWTNDAMRHDSEPIGTFYVHWTDENRLYMIACDERFALDDLLHELAILEEKALGYHKHGVKRL